MLLTLLSILLITTLTISMISELSAADITIGPKTPGGLKKALEKAKNGDTIILKNGVYKGKNNADITIKKNINIRGQGSKVVLDGLGKNQIFQINKKNVKISLKNLKFTNGKAKIISEDSYDYVNGGGAILLIKGSLTVNKCTFTKNKADELFPDDGESIASGGGAIMSFDNLKISQSTFTNNEAEDGGAIYSYQAKLTISQSTFTNNKAFDGGAIYSYYDKIDISKSVFTKNKAGTGGSITVDAGGCFDSKNCPSKIISGSTFTNNKALEGGAIKSGCELFIKKCTFTKNGDKDDTYYTNGGAISSFANLIISQSTFTKNTGAKSGGAIYSQGLTVTKSIFTSNQANEDGGAIYSAYGSKDTVNGCTFTSNYAKKSGGAIHSTSDDESVGVLKITNTNFKNNIAGTKYNAIYKDKKTKLTTKNVKITPKNGTEVKK